MTAHPQAPAYRVGWIRNGRWHYITVTTKDEMLAEVADKTTLSDKVTVKAVPGR